MSFLEIFNGRLLGVIIAFLCSFFVFYITKEAYLNYKLPMKLIIDFDRQIIKGSSISRRKTLIINPLYDLIEIKLEYTQKGSFSELVFTNPLKRFPIDNLIFLFRSKNGTTAIIYQDIANANVEEWYNFFKKVELFLLSNNFINVLIRPLTP